MVTGLPTSLWGQQTYLRMSGFYSWPSNGLLYKGTFKCPLKAYLLPSVMRTEDTSLKGHFTGGRFKREGTYVYLWLIYVDVWQKPTHYCEAIIFQLKINKYEKEQKILKNRTKARAHTHTKYANWSKQVIAATGSMELEHGNPPHSAYTHTSFILEFWCYPKQNTWTIPIDTFFSPINK